MKHLKIGKINYIEYEIDRIYIIIWEVETMYSFSRPTIIDINEGLEEIKNIPNVLLIDVRRPEEYSTGHIAGSINIPLSDIDEVTDITDELDTPIALYCKSGSRAIQAMQELNVIGYDNVASIGGIDKYKGKLV